MGNKPPGAAGGTATGINQIPKGPGGNNVNIGNSSSAASSSTASSSTGISTTKGNEGKGDSKLARRNTNESIRQIVNKGSISTNYIVKEDVVLGRGHYALVNLGIDKRTKKEVAVKRIQIAKSRVEALKAEIEVLTRVGHHANIVELYDIYITDTEVQLVMELLKGGELFDRMVDKGPYSELEASIHIGNIGRALKYLHSKGIVHRDLKPENLILVDKSDNAELKIADFGLSKIVDDVENSMMQTVCGTWAYAAPEVKTASGANGTVAYSYKVDLWSVGVIMFVMLSAYHPFDPDGECTDTQLWANICKGKFDFNDPAWEGISESAKSLICHLIVVDPEKRYGTEELLKHPWILREGINVPMTPITPGIDNHLKAFQTKKKYNGAYTPRGGATGGTVGGGLTLAGAANDDDDEMEVEKN